MCRPQSEIRRAHINHEASVKSVGTVYLIGALFATIGGIGCFAATGSSSQVGLTAVGAIYLLLGILLGFVAFGLQNLKTWARWIAAVFSSLSLILFPMGTLIGGYILYLLISQKGTMVFSAGYQDIIKATPHIKYKTSIVVKILLGIVLGILFLRTCGLLLG